MASLWTESEDTTLRTMLLDKRSPRQVSEVLGRSRMSVIGRAFRLGVPILTPKNPPKTSSPNKEIVPRRLRNNGKRARTFLLKKAKRSSMPLPDRNELSPLIAMNDLDENTCRFPCGDPKDNSFGFCGRPSGRHSYCEYHRTITTKVKS